MVKTVGQQTWIWVLVLPLTSCGTSYLTSLSLSFLIYEQKTRYLSPVGYCKVECNNVYKAQCVLLSKDSLSVTCHKRNLRQEPWLDKFLLRMEPDDDSRIHQFWRPQQWKSMDLYSSAYTLLLLSFTVCLLLPSCSFFFSILAPKREH